MSILSDFEDRVARGVEGVFAGVFRSPVQPAELARACAREMDRRRKLGVGKVYAPTMYSVLLSEEDGSQLGGFADTLAGELETYLISYAREKGYELATRPHVRFLVDEDLKLGRFDIIGELLSAEEIAVELGEDETEDEDEVAAGRKVLSPASAPAAARADVREAAAGGVAAGGVAAGPVPSSGSFFDHEANEAESGADAAGIATLTIGGIQHDVALVGERTVIGRLKQCDVCIPDANTSRQHAAIEQDESGWWIADLGSTNGTLLNGERIDRARLHDGDRITIGITEVVFNEPRG